MERLTGQQVIQRLKDLREQRRAIWKASQEPEPLFTRESAQREIAIRHAESYRLVQCFLRKDYT